MNVLVSFCNLPEPRNTGVIKIDIESEATSEINLGWRQPIESSTGLCAENNSIYALFVSGGVHYLAALMRDDYEPIFHEALPDIKDGHSILAKDGHLYVVSTGTDEVFRYDLGRLGVNNPVVVWRADDSRSDTHHVNSIAEWKGSLVISAFGPKFGTLWASAFDGYIQEIIGNRRIKGGIYHPHSLYARGDRLYYIESYRNLLWCLEGPISSVGSYSRGMCWLSDELVCLASNVGRRLSKSTGLLTNPADPGEPTGKCGVTLMDMKRGRTMKQLNLQWFGPEIYDVLLVG